MPPRQACRARIHFMSLTLPVSLYCSAARVSWLRETRPFVDRTTERTERASGQPAVPCVVCQLTASPALQLSSRASHAWLAAAPPLGQNRID